MIATKKKKTPLNFKKTPLCEITGKPATDFVHQGPKVPLATLKPKQEEIHEEPIRCLKVSELKDQPDPAPGCWRFVATEAPEHLSDYHFEIADFFKSPASTVDWLAHLHEKKWFDASDFCAMMHRFREATGSYGSL